MRLKWLLFLTVLAATPVAAAETPIPVDYTGMSDEQLAERLQAVTTEGFRRPCTDKVPLFAELGRRKPESAPLRADLATAEAFCAADEQRFADGLRAVRRAQATLDEIGMENRVLDRLALYFAQELKDGPELLARLRKLVNANSLADYSEDSIIAWFGAAEQNGMKSEANELAYQVARSENFAYLDADLQEFFAVTGIRHAASVRQLDAVDALVEYIWSPANLLPMLALRDYEPVWPALERQAGQNLNKIVQKYVSWSAKRLADDPEDRDRLARHAEALMFAGKYDEALTIAQDWLHSGDGAASREEGDGWALQVEANVWDQLGETAKADKIYDDLAALPAYEHPWVVNFVINREARLVGGGRWEEAVAASDLAGVVAEEYGNTYAKAIVRSNRACALYNLGRAEEGQRELDFLLSHKRDSPGGTVGALLCASREEQAAALMAEYLADEGTRDSVLSFVQDNRFELPPQLPSALPDSADLVRKRPELLAQFLKYVRLLPERFVPEAFLRKQQKNAGDS